jgi:hypothetical protein
MAYFSRLTINNGSGADAVNIQDGGNSITVDGSLSSIGSITNNVGIKDNGNVISVDDADSSLTVDGTVGVSGIVAVNGTVNINELPDISFHSSNLSAFGDLLTVTHTPVIQGDFVYGLNTQIWNTPTTLGSGATVDTLTGRLRVLSGTDSTGYAYLTTRRIAKYRAGQGTTVRFTPVFATVQANNTQFMGMGNIISNALYDGYFFGYDGTSVGIAHFAFGVQTFYPQTDWNQDKCNGTGASGFNWNPAFGTPVMISYPYLGYGDIKFFLLNPNTGDWVLCHIIKYANTSASPQLSNPNLRFLAYSKNSGNTVTTTMYCGSFSVLLSGTRSFISNPKWAIDATKTGVSTTETNILSIKNATTYNGMPNRSLIRLQSITIGGIPSANSKQTTIRFRINATAGTPLNGFTTINGTTADNGATITSGNSVASYDVTSSTISAGTMIWNTIVVTAGSSGHIDLLPYEIFIAPSEILTISGISNSPSADITVAINWNEDI